MSVIRLPYEPRRGARRAPLDEGLVAVTLLRLAKRGWTIIDPMAGERTIERVGRFLGYNVVSSDIAEGVDARNLPWGEGEVDLVYTHPPYWRATKYTDDPRDLSNAPTYDAFLRGLEECLVEFYRVLKPGGLLVLVIGDYREKGRFYPISADTMVMARRVGFEPLTIWVHEVSASGTAHIGTKFMMSHDYVQIFRKRTQ